VPDADRGGSTGGPIGDGGEIVGAVDQWARPVQIRQQLGQVGDPPCKRVIIGPDIGRSHVTRADVTGSRRLETSERRHTETLGGSAHQMGIDTALEVEVNLSLGKPDDP
jgi:hypothetical protein